MKIGKYPVKHSYKIPRIIADVFSVGLAVFICSVEIMFMTVYDDTLKTYIGGEALEKLMQADSSLGWKHWLTLIFPAAVLAVFAVYIVLVLKSHRLKRPEALRHVRALRFAVQDTRAHVHQRNDDDNPQQHADG